MLYTSSSSFLKRKEWLSFTCVEVLSEQGRSAIGLFSITYVPSSFPSRSVLLGFYVVRDKFSF